MRTILKHKKLFLKYQKNYWKKFLERDWVICPKPTWKHLSFTYI